MESVNDLPARGHATGVVECEDPSRSTSSAPSSAPSFCTDLGSPKCVRSRSPSPTAARAAATHSPSPFHSPNAPARPATQNQADVSQSDLGSPILPTRSLSPIATPSPSLARSPVAIPPPSSMPLIPSTASGSMVTYIRAGRGTGGTPYGPYYPYTQPQPHQQQQQIQQQPTQYPVQQQVQQQAHQQTACQPIGTQSMSTQPGVDDFYAPQRATSAPPSRAISLSLVNGSVALNNADWAQHAGEGAGSGNSTDATPQLEPAITPTYSVVKPYGFLPPPATAPPLKPRWPTARLVSSRRTAASAFTSFAAAPTAALRITSLGGATATKPAGVVASAAPARAQHVTSKGPPPRRFVSNRARCLADNLAFLHRGNTYNPPINERISRLFEVVLPPPASAALVLNVLPSPMAALPPQPPSTPDATAHLDRALQQRRDVAAAERYRSDGVATAADATAADAFLRWGSRRGGSGGSGASGAPAAAALRSFSINAAWMARGGDWVDEAGGGVGVGYSLTGIGAANGLWGPRGRSSGNPGLGDAEDVWGTPYMQESDAPAIVATTAASRSSGSEALHLQGVSYRAAKAATRALADMQRPGISLRMQTLVQDEMQQHSPQPPYQQHMQSQHPQSQKKHPQEPHQPQQPQQPQQYTQPFSRARSQSHPQSPPSKGPAATIWV